MGLDMYLMRMPRYKNATAKDVTNAENYLDWLEEKKNPKSEYKDCTLKQWCGIDESELPPEDVIDFYKGQATYDSRYGWYGVKQEVGYWRKANHIHEWFVQHVQDGEDDCQYHNEVTPEDLEALMLLCGMVLEKPHLASKLLPTQSGFFFGGEDYGEWYFDDLRKTIEIIQDVLHNTDFETEMVYYCSSW